MKQQLFINIFLLFSCQLFFLTSTLAQESPQSTNFRSPMDIPLVVAGNFGEVRSNHFHTGIDFKTQRAEGKKIYAIGDGYISRIGYSHYGYGKALYVTHPNGYTSVYAHLSQFKSPISTFV
ncbi:MAG: M23 family metallopeptidase, partial [Flavobacteriales bacterium]